MASASPHSSRTTRIWIVALMILALLSFLALRRSLGKAMRMNSQTTARASLPQLKPGDEAKIVIEVTGVTAASIEGNVLEKKSETVYRRAGNKTAGNRMKIAFDATTPVVMGKASDVHEAAVLHITANMGSDRVLHARQIVVLTGYVKIEIQ